ncbi:ORFL187C [Human betaherpesvirus 5]|nr:ORFL187C [Human betaherpesvirus 5]QHX40531.1 ORFL187C [Human betaherpesvirus 5]
MAYPRVPSSSFAAANDIVLNRQRRDFCNP